MTKILFVCHGNICRSPMAACILRQMARERGMKIIADSAATSREEIGAGIYPPARRKLKQDFAAVPAVFHHAANGLHMTDQPRHAIQYRFCLRVRMRMRVMMCMRRFQARLLAAVCVFLFLQNPAAPYSPFCSPMRRYASSSRIMASYISNKSSW